MIYNHRNIEKKWQTCWDNAKVFEVDETSEKDKHYVLEMFPYPSGRIHMGHLRNYTIGDVVARYKRGAGFNVLHPIGWDAFGLPAENAAIDRGAHPREWTYQNIEQMKFQLKQLGFSYDWNREIATCDPEYYASEQKFFLKFLEKGLAYRKESWVNWDPVDNTVLANEQVVDGKGWRSGADVERKKISQWFLKITDYAGDLLDAISKLDNWPDRVKLMQEKWIGKSEGCIIHFDIENSDEKLTVFTTRHDTIFGMSFCAISPHHPIAEKLSKENPELGEFIKECNALGTSEEAIEKADKKGFDTGLRVKHPFKDKSYPIYIANFILMEYGSGAVFGCPAHDQRDLDFARKYELEVIPVVSKTGDDILIENEAFMEKNGILINSEFLNGMNIADAKEEVARRFEASTQGERKINYRIRDWGISRQRYWGCPIPVIYCDDCGIVPVPETDLPVILPEDVTFDKPGNPLENHPTWKHTKCPICGIDAIRETDTFDTFFESSWYFARFCTTKDNHEISYKACKKWLPVDTYIGGIEHAVMHLLYARFFTRALTDVGYLNLQEPFETLLNQGMVCHQTFKDSNGNWLYPEDVENNVHKQTGKPVTVGRTEKMSKSKKNVVDPLGIIKEFGADTARLFMLSDSPPEMDLQWSDAGIKGTRKFLDKLWRMVVENETSNTSTADDKLQKLIHKTIKGVSEDIEKFAFNTVVAKIRTLANEAYALPANNTTRQEAIKVIVQLISPMTPHIAEELWEKMGETTPLHNTPWLEPDPKFLEDDTVIIAVQVNGKLRGTLSVSKTIEKGEIEKQALELVSKHVENKEIRKIIVIPGKIVNVVV